ncbi:MAG: tRNA (adenosine(37)-N6)-dimethylallyltransferase MiaA [bacterium]
MPEPQPIPIICGPTATGKTSIAVELAASFPLEIVSADSRQIIRRLDIGTAKPDCDERRRIVFHLIDLIEPGERYSAFHFMEDARQAIEEILSRGRIPVVVGGTGFYLRALTEGISEIEQDDMAVRQRLEDDMQQHGQTALYERLVQIDPVEAARLHPNNRVRVIRALEVYYLTGRTRTELAAKNSGHKNRFDYRYFCLMPDRQQLYHDIETRVDRMMSAGLLQEITALVDEGMHDQLERAAVIGYSELLDHIDGHTSLEEAVSRIKQNTRRYAKRQMTWFRNQIEGSFCSDRDSLSRNVAAALSQ